MALLTIANEVKSCRECELRRKCRNTTPGTGRPTARIMVVGGNPGRDESSEGIPFIGADGVFQSNLLEYIGINESELYFTYLVKCFPGWQRGRGFIRPTADQIKTCSSYLKQEIEEVKPELIIAIGDVVMKWLGIKGGINQNSGEVFDTKYGKVVVILFPPVWKHLNKAPQYATSLRYIKTFFEGSPKPPEHGGASTWANN